LIYEHKLAVECDEESSHSSDIQILADIEREQFLKFTLDCAFIRYRPEEKDFSMAALVNECFKVIHTCK
jgi:hypothetical protein